MIGLSLSYMSGVIAVYRRPIEPEPPETTYDTETPPDINLYTGMYHEIPDLVCGDGDSQVNVRSGYQSLQVSTNMYESLDQSTVAPARPPPVKPKPKPKPKKTDNHRPDYLYFS